MSVATEEQRIRNLFERVETIEEVAGTFPGNDDRRARLLAVSRDALAEEGTVRPAIAAKILGLSEKTVRAWAAAGLLSTRQHSPRLLLDVPSVHEVSHVLREIRADGLQRELLGQVWRRLADQALLDRADLCESIEQMGQGDVVVLRPLAASGPASRPARATVMGRGLEGAPDLVRDFRAVFQGRVDRCRAGGGPP